jgi:hypothetical protein
MRNLDFTSWSALLSTLLALVVITLIGVGIRLLVMQTIQQRRERENRQINERLRTLIAAYKTLGGSFTGELAVDPTHLRDVMRAGASGAVMATSDRARRTRDAREAALSDIILLGTEQQVRLAANAATELAAGKPVHTHDLVVSLRDFIRSVLDLDAVPGDVAMPRQGPARPGTGGRAKGDNAQDSVKPGGGKEGGGGMAGAGAGIGLGLGHGLSSDDEHEDH